MTNTHAEYANVVVHVDDDPASDARVACAAQFARNTGAELTGVYAIPDVRLPPYAGYARAKQGVELLKALQAQQQKRAEVIETRFNQSLSPACIRGKWHASQSTPFDSVTEQARYADLVILGQPDTAGWHPGKALYIGAVVLGCGRPVLVLPRAGAPELPVDRVLVAWDGSPEAVRSVNDALPLLRRAKNVTVLGVRAWRHDPSDDCARICQQLGRHDVEAEPDVIDAGAGSAGEAILTHAAHCDSGMLVMGGYGHSRIRELVLGGTTKHVLTHAPLPVFLSH